MQQLDKILQSQGFGSRKHCQQLILKGHVQVSGQLIKDFKQKFATDNLSFSIFGEHYDYRSHVYIALNKPQGYECSHQPQQHHSVFSLFPEHLIARHLQSVGRLDQDTTGLLLLTDDGQYLHALTHPRKHIAKFYQMQTRDSIDEQQINTLAHGVELRNEKGLFVAHDIQQLADQTLRFSIHQGVYHQVKRMLHAVGNEVIHLHRDQIAALTLEELNLKEGKWCYLTQEQYQKTMQFIKNPEIE